MASQTTVNMVEEVRSLLGELNTSSVDTERDIMPALNRAQDKAANILASSYQSPLLAHRIVLTGSEPDFPIPLDALEQRIERIEYRNSTGTFTPIPYMSAVDTSHLETTYASLYPVAYTTIGMDVRILPKPAQGMQIRVWFAKEPAPLSLPQGRILRAPQATDTWVLVDAVGSKIEAMGYMTIVDGVSGKSKGSFQVQKIQGQRIYIQPVPSRGEVDGQDILGSMKGLLIAADDYVVPVGKTCISIMRKPLTNFLIQAAVADITRKLGGAVDWETRILQDLEKTVQRSWTGREGNPKVKRTNRLWSRR